MKEVVCHIQNCLSCKSCELACAAAHSQTKNLKEAIRQQDLPTQRVRIEYVDDKGTLRKVRALAIQCRHCKEALCAQACITGGISKDPVSGDTVMDPEKCVGCWSCIMVCPIGAVTKSSDGKKALKCDHCPDQHTPACVEACPTKAMMYIEEPGHSQDTKLETESQP